MPWVESGRSVRPFVVRVVYDHRDSAFGWFDVLDDDATGSTASTATTATPDHDRTAHTAAATATVTLDRRSVRVLVVVLLLLLLQVRMVLVLMVVLVMMGLVVLILVVVLLLLMLVTAIVLVVLLVVVVVAVVVVVVFVIQVVVVQVVFRVVVVLDGSRTTCMANDPAGGLRPWHSRDAQFACRWRLGDGARGLPTGVDVCPHVLRRIDCLDHDFVERRLWRHVMNVFHPAKNVRCHSCAGSAYLAHHCPLPSVLCVCVCVCSELSPRVVHHEKKKLH